MHKTAANDTLLWLYMKDTVLSVYTEFNAMKLIYRKDL